MLTVVTLIVLGVLLLVVEIVVLPGITVAGIAGGISVIAGIIVSYVNFGATTGHLTVLGALILCVVAMFFSLRAKTWRRLALKQEINSSVDESPVLKDINIGDEGIALTRLAPMGKVRIGNVNLEAKTLLGFIENGAKIIVVKFEDSKVIVKEKN